MEMKHYSGINHLSWAAIAALVVLANSCDGESVKRTCSSSCKSSDAYCDHKKNVYYECVFDGECRVLKPEKEDFRLHCGDVCVTNCSLKDSEDTIHCNADGTYDRCMKDSEKDCTRWMTLSDDYDKYCKNTKTKTCTNECDLDTTKCDRENKTWNYCTYGDSECLVWEKSKNEYASKCPEEAGKECVHQCIVDEESCDFDNNVYKFCMEDENHCRVWKESNSLFGSKCEKPDDSCKTCTLSEVNCDPDQKVYLTCQADPDGCTKWVAGTVQEYDEHCGSDDKPCNDACRIGETSSDGTQVCVKDENGCLVWETQELPDDDKEYVVAEIPANAVRVFAAVEPNEEWYALAWSTESKSSKAKIFVQRFKFPNIPMDTAPVEIYTAPAKESFMTLESMDISKSGNIAVGWSFLPDGSRHVALMVLDNQLKMKYQRGVAKTYSTLMDSIIVRFAADDRLYAFWEHDISGDNATIAMGIFSKPESYSGDAAKEADGEYMKTDVFRLNPNAGFADLDSVSDLDFKIANDNIYLTWIQYHDGTDGVVDYIKTARLDMKGNVVKEPVSEKVASSYESGYGLDSVALDSGLISFAYAFMPSKDKTGVKYKRYQDTTKLAEVKLNAMKGSVHRISSCMAASGLSLVMWQEIEAPDGEIDDYYIFPGNTYWTAIDAEAKATQQINSSNIDGQYAIKAYCTHNNKFYLLWNSCDKTHCNVMFRNVTSLVK